MIVVTIIGIFITINCFLIYILGFLYLSSYGSAYAQLPGCFRPWTFSLNIGFNMFPLDSFMSCLHSLLVYSTGEFQALQLIRWGCLVSSFNVQCLLYLSLLFLASPPICVLSHCSSHYYPVAFRGICAPVLQIYSKRKLTNPHFQEKTWSISVHHCQYIWLPAH